MPDDLKLTPDAEAALAERMAEVNELGDQMTREERGEFRKGFAAALALRGSGEFRDWRVNDDGSMSPPGHTHKTARVFAGIWRRPEYLEDGQISLAWYYDSPCTGGIGVNYDSFADAARALLAALEESDD